MRGPGRRQVQVCLTAMVALALAGCGSGSGGGPGEASSTPPAHAGSATTPAGATLGHEPCSKLISFEEIAAATGVSPALVDIVADGQCDYEDDSGFAVLSVILVNDPAGHLSCTSADGTYLGHPVEAVAGLGDKADWSPSAMSVCAVKGSNRVQISLSTHVDDPKAVSVGLATAAVGRLP